MTSCGSSRILVGNKPLVLLLRELCQVRGGVYQCLVDDITTRNWVQFVGPENQARLGYEHVLWFFFCNFRMKTPYSSAVWGFTFSGPKLGRNSILSRYGVRAIGFLHLAGEFCKGNRRMSPPVLQVVGEILTTS